MSMPLRTRLRRLRRFIGLCTYRGCYARCTRVCMLHDKRGETRTSWFCDKHASLIEDAFKTVGVQRIRSMGEIADMEPKELALGCLTMTVCTLILVWDHANVLPYWTGSAALGLGIHAVIETIRGKLSRNRRNES